MAHWSNSPGAAQALEDDYAIALDAWRNDQSEGNRRALDILAIDLRAARQYWREAGEYVTATQGPDAEGARTMVKITSEQGTLL